jgi:hypothetical protein
MKAYWGSGGIAPRILELSTIWRWVVSFTPRPLYPQGKSWVGPRAVLDAVVKRKIPSTRLESNPRTPIVQPIAQRYTDWAITSKCIAITGSEINRYNRRIAQPVNIHSLKRNCFHSTFHCIPRTNACCIWIEPVPLWSNNPSNSSRTLL